MINDYDETIMTERRALVFCNCRVLILFLKLCEGHVEDLQEQRQRRIKQKQEFKEIKERFRKALFIWSIVILIR